MKHERSASDRRDHFPGRNRRGWIKRILSGAIGVQSDQTGGEDITDEGFSTFLFKAAVVVVLVALSAAMVLL